MPWIKIPSTPMRSPRSCTRSSERAAEVRAEEASRFLIDGFRSQLDDPNGPERQMPVADTCA